MGKGNLARGASVMVISVTIAKVLGLIYIIPLSRLIGKEGLGIYSMAYSLYIILQTFSTSGFPTAMAKLVSEKLALKQFADVEQMYRVTMRLVTLFGIILFLVMWVGAPVYAHMIALKESSQAVLSVTLSIRALSFALLVVPLESGLRGYLQGFQELEPSAHSQTVEQLVRVLAMVLGTYLVVKHGGSVSDGAAAATFGAFVGGVAGLALLVFAVIPIRRDFQRRMRAGLAGGSARAGGTERAGYLRGSGRVGSSGRAGYLGHSRRSGGADTGRRAEARSFRETARALWRVGFPVTLGNLVVPISGLVDSLTVVNLLIFSGMTYNMAQGAYGLFSRQAMQLIQLPLAFAFAIGSSVLPAIAEATALKDQNAIGIRVTGTIRSMMFMTLPVAVTLLILARPIDLIWAGDTDGAAILSSVCFMSIFSSLELISTYMLQGFGKMYRPVRNMFIGVFIKLAFNLILIPPFHVMGAAIATTLGYLVSSCLNVMAVKKYGRLQFSVWKLSMPLVFASVALCITLASVSFISYQLGHMVTHVPIALAVFQVIVSVGIGGVVYVFFCIALGAVTREELQRIPFVGRRLARFAPSAQGGR